MPAGSGRGCFVLLALAGPAAMAADMQVQPSVEVRAETHTNRSLEPDGSETDESVYRAELAALFGFRTPLSNTTVRPMVRMQYNPDREDKERVDAFLDLSSGYRSERSTFEIVGLYEHQDLADAELADAGFDDLDPQDPTAPQTGRATVGQSRDRAQVRPDYVYEVTERFGVGARGTYEIIRYDDTVAFRRVDYDYGLGEGYLAWAVDPKTDVIFGVYASRYETQADLSLTTDAVGISLDFDHRWSETLRTKFELGYEWNDFEQLDIEDPTLPVIEDSSSGWSALLTGIWQGEISSFQMAAGRILTPGGEGVKKESDQFRLEYKRELGPRLRFRGAVRYTEERPVRVSTTDNFREYARGELKLEWLVSQKWYLTGGYSYTWQEYRADPSDADDHSVFVGVGYRGLPIEGDHGN